LGEGFGKKDFFYLILLFLLLFYFFVVVFDTAVPNFFSSEHFSAHAMGPPQLHTQPHMVTMSRPLGEHWDELPGAPSRAARQRLIGVVAPPSLNCFFCPSCLPCACTLPCSPALPC
jgi:hypothetical protein